MLLLPLLFIPLLGYAIAATREDSPPRWVVSARLLSDGFWTALVIALTALPFLVALVVLQPSRDGTVAGVVIVASLLLLWGLVALLLLPHATATFAASGNPRDLFDFAASVRGVSTDFATWNVAVAAIVSGWAIGLACAALLCVGVVPGIFYAILVSAHATAALQGQSSRSDSPPG